MSLSLPIDFGQEGNSLIAEATCRAASSEATDITNLIA